MTEHWFDTEKGTFYCWRWGRGGRVLIAWHGYGSDGAMFEALADTLGDIFTIYAPDLPWHGRTQWRAASYTPEDVAALTEQLLAHAQVERFSLLGCSFGARVALKLLPYAGHQLESLYLLSPDGIHTRWLNVGRKVPKWLRSRLMQRLENPERLLHWSRQLHRRGRVPFFVTWFLRKNLRTPESRRRLLGNWRSFDAFVTKKQAIKRQLARTVPQVVVIIGSRDQLIKGKSIGRFVRSIPDAQLHVLPCNHVLKSNEVTDILRMHATTSPARL